jgi:hypothetical protein
VKIENPYSKKHGKTIRRKVKYSYEAGKERHTCNLTWLMGGLSNFDAVASYFF